MKNVNNKNFVFFDTMNLNHHLQYCALITQM